MNNNRKALKSGIWYIASNFLIKGIGFITTPIFTRILTKTEFGLYSNYTSWLSILMVFVTLNLEATLISARYDFEEDFDSYILSVLILSSISCLLWAIVFNIFGYEVSKFTHIEQIYLNAMMLYLLFLPAINFFQARERYFFEYKKSVAMSLMIALSTSVLSVILVSILDNRLLGRIIGAVTPTIALGFGIYTFFIIKGKHLKIKYWSYAIPICIPYIPHLLASSLLNSMDRVMIERICGSEMTAIYSLAYSCGAIVTLFINALNSAFAPWLGEKLHEKKYLEVCAVSKKYICVFMYFAIGLMLFAPEILFIMGGNEYIDAKYVITPVAMGCVCHFLYQLFGNVEQFERKTIGMAIASATAALINYILNAIFIPKIGYLAAAYTTLIGELCLLSIHMILVFRLKLSQIYDYKFVIGTVIIGIVLMLIITYLYTFNALIRYCVVIGYSIVTVHFCINNKQFLETIFRKH